MFRSACCFGAALALCVSMFGQSRPPTPTPTPTTPTPGTTGIPNRSPFPTNPSTTSGPDLTRPIYLSGRVMLDDGTPPPEPVSIQRVCGANPHTEAYTDSKGRFSFEWGQRLGVMPDASENNMGNRMPGMSSGSSTGSSGGTSQRNPETQMMGCELRAQLAGFRSDSVSLTQHRSMDNPDVGTIILHRSANVQGIAISATTLMAPKDARKAYEKGLNDLKKDKLEDAQRDFDKAVEVYPKFAAAWFELGCVQRDLKNMDGAKKSYAQALAADPKYVKPYVEMAEIAFHDQSWQDVKDGTDRLLSLNAVDFPKAWYYNAIANYQLKQYDAAEKSARDGMKNDPGNTMPRMNQLLGVLLAGKNDYPGAAEALRNYLKVAPNGPEAETVRKQLAAVEQRMQANAAPAKEEQK